MKILILLSSCNGARFLPEQLDSLLAQRARGVEILDRDDGSTDESRAILERYRRDGKLRWYGGENLGPARSFWQLLHDSGDADYYAFCDQDDVWDADKLEIAVSALSGIDPELPALYCGDVRVTDAALRPVSDHMLRDMPTDYSHALVKNIAPGCTFVFNRAAKKLLCRYDAEKLGIELHDWLAFQIISCFGKVVFDPQPHMSYRQHGDNVIGAAASGLQGRLRKLNAFWSGDKRCSRARNAVRLEQAYGDAMAPDARMLTADFAHYREEPRRKRRMLRLKLRLPRADRAAFHFLVRFNRL